MDHSSLNTDQHLFKTEAIDQVLHLSLKEKPLAYITDLKLKKDFLDYLDHVSHTNQVKALIIKASPLKMTGDEYAALYKGFSRSSSHHTAIERMINAINQIFLKMVEFEKPVVFADSGREILLLLGFGLACDYRVVAEDTVYYNPDIGLGTIPKGASVFFLSRMLGRAAATRILLSEEDLTAGRAKELGIVDEVVPLADLDRSSLAAARRFARLPLGYSQGVKKLIQNCRDDLCKYFSVKDQLVRCQLTER